MRWGEAQLNTVICWCVLIYVVGREICLDLAVQVLFCHSNIFSHVPVVCMVGQNPPIVSGDRVQTMLLFTVFIVWWRRKSGQGNQNLIIFLIIPMIQYKKFGWDPSFGSRNRVQTSFLGGQNVTFKVLVWPWKWGQCHQNLIISYQSLNGFFAHLVKIHQLVQEIECRQGSFHFYSLYSVLTLKIRPKSPKSNQFF